MTFAQPSNPTADELRRTFDSTEPWTLGVEEELMLLDASGQLAPLIETAMEAVGADPRFKRELPATQLEIALPPTHGVPETVAALAAARADLSAAADGRFLVAGTGLHPTAPPAGPLNGGERNATIEGEYGLIAARQQLGALQIHVAPGSADRALAIYNALRGYLPEIAALAANSPYHDGADTGLASYRPKVAEGLPRQGVPPAVGSWEEYAEALRWTTRAGAIGPGMWWWELRLHPAHGTLELRVPDTQTTVGEAAPVIAFAHSLVAWLGARSDAGEELAAHPRWRIEQNRWSANRFGVEAELADLQSGERVPVRERIEALLAELAPVAADLGCAAELEGVRSLLECNGAMRQRQAVAASSIDELPGWLAARFLDPAPWS
jgi:carboxylate-amine ligase